MDHAPSQRGGLDAAEAELSEAYDLVGAGAGGAAVLFMAGLTGSLGQRGAVPADPMRLGGTSKGEHSDLVARQGRAQLSSLGRACRWVPTARLDLI